MHKGLEYTPLPLEVENASSNSLTVFPSLDFDDLYCQGSPFDDDPLSDSSQYQPCSESWDDFQSLSPFGADWEMEQEFFKSDFTEFDCKPQGPTLAELNNQRSTSPLINPEMERLHRIATRTDADDLRSTGTSSPYGEIKIRIDGPEKLERNTEKEYSSSKIENTLRYNDVYQKRFTADQKESCKNDSLLNQNTVSSTTVKQELTETIELNHCNSMKTITLLAAKANSQTTTENHQNTPSQYSETILSKVAPVKPRTRTASESTNEDEQLSAIQEESDEDMDSDDEFEDSPDKDCEIPAKQRKGRRGDTEDMIPNPRKLLEISRELNRLTKIITDLKPIHSLPMTARNKSKKEKNKLASRACRLKKKAQHESNKLKLHGLELEQKRLVCLIEQVKVEIIRDTQGYTVSGELSNKVEKLIHSSIGSQVVAGHTTAFVESVLKATASTTLGFKEVDIHLNI